MKAFKKLMSAIATVAMTVTVLLGSGIPVNAGENYTLTIDNAKGHSFTIYQIFTGDVSGYTQKSSDEAEENDQNPTVLSNIEWSDKVTDTEITNQTPEEWIGDMTQEEIADAVKGLVKNGKVSHYSIIDNTGDNATDSVSVNNLPAGYYVVVDTTTVNDSETSQRTDTAMIINLVGDTKVETKAVLPTDTKKVQDDEEDDMGSGTDFDNNGGFGQGADHAIGEEFKYLLTATVPGSAKFDSTKTDAITSYPITFVDNMSQGLDFVANSDTGNVDKVAIRNVGGTYITLNSSQYTFTGPATEGAVYTGGQVFTVTVDPVALHLDLDLTKDIEIEVEYTAKLNENAVVETKNVTNGSNTDNPNESHIEYPKYDNTGTATGTAETPDKEVYTFTYAIRASKVDGNNAALSGAGFSIFTDETSANNAVTAVKNKETVDYTNALKFKNGVPSNDADASAMILTSEKTITGDDGNPTTIQAVDFSGLDEGTYWLVETQTPEGYNNLNEAIKVKIEADHDADGQGKLVTLTYSSDDNTMSENVATIQNNKGTTLPSTGGMGTTIFYIAGSVLVIAAAVILISRKRMSGSED